MFNQKKMTKSVLFSTLVIFFFFISIPSILSTSRCDLISEYCARNNSGCPSSSNNVLRFGGNSTASFTDYDVISFGDLGINSGDVQRRAAIRDNFIANSSGVSIGDQISPTFGDPTLKYALVVGRNAVFINGEVFPIGANQENIFVGGTFTGAENLRGRVAGNCTTSGCLDADFTNSLSYYTQVSQVLQNLAANVDVAVDANSGVATLRCQSASATLYIASIRTSDFSKITSYSVSNCPTGALWVFNIFGTTNVVRIDGVTLQEKIIYNIIGSKSIFSQTFIYGTILAPTSSFNQTGGTIFGTIIAGNIPILIQSNRCNNGTTPSTSTSTATGTATGVTGVTGVATTGSVNTSTSTGATGVATTGRSNATTGVATTGRANATSTGATGVATTGRSNATSTSTGATGVVTTGKSATATGATATGATGIATTRGLTTFCPATGKATTGRATSTGGTATGVTATGTTTTAKATTGAGTGSVTTKSVTASTTGRATTDRATTGRATTGRATTGRATTGLVTGTATGTATGLTGATTSSCVCPVCPTSTGTVTGTATGTVTGSTTGNTPQRNTTTCTTPNCPFVDYDNECASEFTLGSATQSFKDYDVVVFGDFTANTGDVEGRLLTFGKVTLGNGFSIGVKVESSANDSVAYALIAGSLNFTSGAVYPDGSSGAKENIFVAGAFNVPSFLTDRVTGRCPNGTINCLDTIRDSARDCYTALQEELAGNSDNVQFALMFSTLFINCTSTASENIYRMTVPTSTFNQITSYNLNNCNADFKWIITISAGSNPNTNATSNNSTTGNSVLFRGGAFPATAVNVLYNILGSNRTIEVSTGVYGAILSPRNHLNQPGGVVNGKVIVGSAFVLQINKPVCTYTSNTGTCPTNSTSTSGSVTGTGSATSGSVTGSGSATSGSNLRRAAASDVNVNGATSVSLYSMWLVAAISLIFLGL